MGCWFSAASIKPVHIPHCVPWVIFQTLNVVPISDTGHYRLAGWPDGGHTQYQRPRNPKRNSIPSCKTALCFVSKTREFVIVSCSGSREWEPLTACAVVGFGVLWTHCLLCCVVCHSWRSTPAVGHDLKCRQRIAEWLTVFKTGTVQARNTNRS